ncbi:MAG: sodium/proton-translocating pyrophosphatase, partial [Myxococcales bacterium]|nr:sodium/proton-translocating pyrophosphatase [Myxococcales bacterium]
MDSQTLLLLAPIAGVIALAYAFTTAGWIGKQDAGNTEMKAIAAKIQEGAMAFLGAEYRVLGLFVLVVAGVLVGLNVATGKGSPLIGVAFVVGALCSALAGYAGMRVATQANVRTAAAARTGLSPALTVAFRGGAVMGMSVVGL